MAFRSQLKKQVRVQNNNAIEKEVKTWVTLARVDSLLWIRKNNVKSPARAGRQLTKKELRTDTRLKKRLKRAAKADGSARVVCGPRELRYRMGFENPTNPQPRFSFKVTRTTLGATWELKFADLPLNDEEALQILCERGRKYAQQEFLNATNQIPVINLKK
jgi:hypothetical protein